MCSVTLISSSSCGSCQSGHCFDFSASFEHISASLGLVHFPVLSLATIGPWKGH